MIVKKQFAKCDICGTETELAAKKAAEMLKEMKDRGWEKIGLRHFCQSCLERDWERDRR